MISREPGSRDAAGDAVAGTRNESDRLAGEPAGAVEVLRAVWSARGQSAADIEELLGPQKSCQAMRDVGFGGMADSGADLRSAWRDTLERDGKLSRDGGSVRDLVLGRPDTRAE